MASPLFDFSHLTPEERIQLAEDLWDSLPESDILLTDAQRAELDRRLALEKADPGSGRRGERCWTKSSGVGVDSPTRRQPRGGR
jgi:putative addiction module component (TIGR02574 family)